MSGWCLCWNVYICAGDCGCQNLSFPMALQLQVVLSYPNCNQAFRKRSNTLHHWPTSSDPIQVFFVYDTGHSAMPMVNYEIWKTTVCFDMELVLNVAKAIEVMVKKGLRDLKSRDPQDNEIKILRTLKQLFRC